MEATNSLELYLREAHILAEVAPIIGGGGHPDKKRLLLAGGVQVIAKLAFESQPDSDRMMRREVAGWEVAKALGWTGLVAATVLRLVPHGETEADASVQVFWPDGNQFCAPIDSFPEEEIWQAAIFDTVVAHGDRGMNNWLAVPAPGGEHPPALKLVDNGHAFGHPSLQVPPNSTFYQARQGQEIPERCLEAVDQLVDAWPIEELAELVDQEECDRTIERAKLLLHQGVLAVSAE